MCVCMYVCASVCVCACMCVFVCVCECVCVLVCVFDEACGSAPCSCCHNFSYILYHPLSLPHMGCVAAQQLCAAPQSATWHSTAAFGGPDESEGHKRAW